MVFNVLYLVALGWIVSTLFYQLTVGFLSNSSFFSFTIPER